MRAKAAYGGLTAAVLDLSKAFDSVSHRSILRAARANGCPPPLLAYLEDYYASATSWVGDRVVRCGRGVRQGDPLSPLLFLMVMRKALDGIDAPPSVRVGADYVHALAYADDVVLLAASDPALQRSLSSLADNLQSAGLTVNP